MFSLLRGAGASGLTTDRWNELARNEGLGVSRKADLYDIRAALKAKGLSTETDGMFVEEINHPMSAFGL